MRHLTRRDVDRHFQGWGFGKWQKRILYEFVNSGILWLIDVVPPESRAGSRPKYKAIFRAAESLADKGHLDIWWAEPRRKSGTKFEKKTLLVIAGSRNSSVSTMYEHRIKGPPVSKMRFSRRRWRPKLKRAGFRQRWVDQYGEYEF